MKALWTVLITATLVLLAAGLVWLGQRPPQTRVQANPATQPAGASGPTLRLGLIPERDIFEQRRQYQALVDFLSARLHRRVELVSLNTYESVLGEFAREQIDGAFLGSMVAVLAMDRYGARVLLKPEYPGGISSYSGVIIVQGDSTLHSVADLRGHSLGMVRTTTAANLFPIHALLEEGMLGEPKRFTLRWMGTHDEVITEVLAGTLTAGAVKSLRLDAYEREHPGQKPLRRLLQSPPVPENALLVRRNLDRETRKALEHELLAMTESAQGLQTLEDFGAVRFLPCKLAEYEAIFSMIEHLGPHWDQVGVAGPRPQRPVDPCAAKAEGGKP